MAFLKPFIERVKVPQSFLSVINVFCALVGMAVGIIVARTLGAEQFGLLAVLTGIIAVTTNLLDVRLLDLISKLYYRGDLGKRSDIQEYRASVIQVGMIAYAAASLFLFILGFLAAFVTGSLFTKAEIQTSWMLGLSLSRAMQYFGSPFTFTQRFSEKFFLMGSFQLLSALARALILLAVLHFDPSLTGYTIGAILAALTTLAFAVGFSSFLWLKYEKLPVLGRFNFMAFADYYRNIRFIVMGNFLGYTKLLHRAADVLLVGYFCDDRQTGLYKLARTMTDAFYVLYDAINKVYQPAFLRMFSQESFLEYRRTAKRLIVNTAWATLLIVVLEVVGISWLLYLLFGSRYAGAESSIMLLTIPFFFVTGLHTWMWPTLVHKGELGLYTFYSLLAAVFGQYALGIVLLVATKLAYIECFSMGYLSYYIVLYLPVYLHVRKTSPEVVAFNLA